MWVVDGANLFEVADQDVLSNQNGNVSLSFAEFERLTCDPSGLVRACFFANLLKNREAIVALKRNGVAWGVRIKVSADANVPYSELEVVVIFPIASAIQVFFEMKEASRREGVDTYVPPKPYVDNDVQIQFKLRELTVSQRVFLTCLPPAGTGFQPRQKVDQWTKVLEKKDEREFLQKNKASRLPFDLPDEVLMHVLGLRISEEMSTAKTIQAQLCTLLQVSRQFGRATRQEMAAMQNRVRLACESMSTTQPTSIERCQSLLQSVSLPLRAALQLRGPWHEYVRARRAHEKRS